MRILIVDDSPEKVRRLKDALNLSGIEQLIIDVAGSASEGRKLLKANDYELLVLDLVLPNRPDQPADVSISMSLLEEISQSDELTRPRKILGLTAFDEAEIAAAPLFSDWLWYIVRYDETSNDWAEPIVKSAQYLANRRPDSEEYDYDLCVVTALRSEMEAVHKLQWNWRTPQPIDDTTFVRIGAVKDGNTELRIVSAYAPRMGMVSTALLCAKLIAAFRPRFLAMAGICAGVRGKVNIGDVILADPTWDWQSGKRTRDKENTQFSIGPHQLATAEFLRSRFLELSADATLWNDIRAKWASPSSTMPRLLLGPVASGSAVLADGQVIADIREQHRNLLGVEMEAYGLYASAINAAHPRPTPFALKAVCDFADEEKSDDHQAYAAYMSAMALEAFCRRYLVQIRPYAGRA